MNFSVDKKGYNIEEVDAYLLERERESRKVQDDQIERIRSLRQELDAAKVKIRDYEARSRAITDAMVVAVQKANEYEAESRRRCDAELAQLKEFHDKWNRYYAQLTAKYPTDETLTRAEQFDSTLKNVLEQIEAKHAQSKMEPLRAEELQYRQEKARLESTRGINRSAIADALADAAIEDQRYDKVAASWGFMPRELSGYLESTRGETAVSAVLPEDSDVFSFEEALHPTDSLDDIMADLGMFNTTKDR